MKRQACLKKYEYHATPRHVNDYAYNKPNEDNTTMKSDITRLRWRRDGWLLTLAVVAR